MRIFIVVIALALSMTGIPAAYESITHGPFSTWSDAVSLFPAAVLTGLVMCVIAAAPPVLSFTKDDLPENWRDRTNQALPFIAFLGSVFGGAGIVGFVTAYLSQFPKSHFMLPAFLFSSGLGLFVSFVLVTAALRFGTGRNDI